MSIQRQINLIHFNNNIKSLKKAFEILKYEDQYKLYQACLAVKECQKKPDQILTGEAF
jgi:hypothetical protein